MTRIDAAMARVFAQPVADEVTDPMLLEWTRETGQEVRLLVIGCQIYVFLDGQAQPAQTAPSFEHGAEIALALRARETIR